MFVVNRSGKTPAPLCLRIALIFGLFAGLQACGLPATAPTSLELTKASDDDGFNYSTVKINARVVSVLTQFRPTFGPAFKSGHYSATNALYPGDAVGVTVYETGGSSLFPPPSVVSGAAATAAAVGSVATGASNVPPQVIEADGTIFVPFVGRVKVSGLTPGQAGTLIEQDLQGKAVSPQVMVSLVNNIGNAVTVSGEVASAKSVPLSSRGERLLDVIAAAGGAKFPAYETYVQVVRKGQVGNVLLQTIVNNPVENFIVRPRDQIYLSHNPRTYSVLGAAQKVSLYPFAYEKVSLADALAQAGGPVDIIGDPSGIYLFRFEPWLVAKDVLEPGSVDSYGSNPP